MDSNPAKSERDVLAERERKFDDFARTLGRGNLVKPDGTVGPDPRYSEERAADDFQVPVDIHGRRIGRMPDFEDALEQIHDRLSRPQPSPDQIAEARVIDVVENLKRAARRRDDSSFFTMLTTYLRGIPGLEAPNILIWNVETVARLRINLLISLGFELGRVDYLYRAHELSAKYHLPWERRALIEYALKRLDEIEKDPKERRAMEREFVRLAPADETTRQGAERLSRMGYPMKKSKYAYIRREIEDDGLERAA